MKDLFSDVHTWWSCLGMSICTHAQGSGVTTKHALQKDVNGGRSWGGCFMAMEDGEDSVAGPLQPIFGWSQMQKQVLNAADG